MSLVEKFCGYVAREGLFTHDDRLLLAVSGGVDSMVLMSLVHEAGYRFAVAHCNFHLRGAESDGDELLVEDEVRKLGVPYYLANFDTYGEVAATGESIEMAARRLRYAWFDQLCEGHGYSKVVIAHHGDDSIETLFINMLRGTGVRGLTGIASRNGRIVRPLLFATREEILSYAQQKGVPFREDSSNMSMKHLRNRVRHEVVPMLKTINPQFAPIMQRNMTQLLQAQNFIDASIKLIERSIVTESRGVCTINVAAIDSALPRNFVIYEILSSRFGFRRDVVGGICAALDDAVSGRRFYAHGMVAVVDREQIIIMPAQEDCREEIAVAQGEDIANIGSVSFGFDTVHREAISILNQGAEVALLDADKLRFPLVIRRWRDGDAMVPLGMTGRKKISDMLVDSKASLVDKREQYVVVSGNDIVWLVGRRIDNRYAISNNTSRVLRISVARR